jgi:hypothetical protein
MALIAIDPGKVTGFAVFAGSTRPLPPLWANGREGDLVSATACTEEQCLMYIENEGSQRKPAGDCLIEVPQVYPGQQQKGDQNDLIKLAVMVGRYADRATACGFRVTLYKPREWKGQLPKDVCWRRVRDSLTSDELSVMAKLPKSRAHNMHDAIGLGTWFQKRWR